MFRVRVNKIESIRDLDGNLGKRIELVEERKIPSFVVRPKTGEAKMVQDVLQAVQQQLPMFPVRKQFAVPKIILFLTEQEYERLSIDFDVNQVYEITLENQAVKFRKTESRLFLSALGPNASDGRKARTSCSSKRYRSFVYRILHLYGSRLEWVLRRHSCSKRI